MASLSPEGPPASRAGPVRARCDLPLSSGWHWVEAERKRRRVKDGEGRLEAGSLVGWCGHAVLGSACREAWVDEVPSVHGHLHRMMEG